HFRSDPDHGPGQVVPQDEGWAIRQDRLELATADLRIQKIEPGRVDRDQNIVIPQRGFRHFAEAQSAILEFVEDEGFHDDLFSNLLPDGRWLGCQSAARKRAVAGKLLGKLKMRAIPGIRHTAGRASACPHGRQTFPEIPGPPPRSLARSDLSVRATYR